MYSGLCVLVLRVVRSAWITIAGLFRNLIYACLEQSFPSYSLDGDPNSLVGDPTDIFTNFSPSSTASRPKSIHIQPPSEEAVQFSWSNEPIVQNNVNTINQ